jgi:formylglycine-generating enzyme required for sulfatase activity
MEDFVDTASRLTAEGFLVEAREVLARGIAAMPGSWRPSLETGGEREVAFWSQDEFDAYCGYCETVERANVVVHWVGPSYTRAYALLAEFDAADGRDADALAAIDRALALEPDHPRLLLAKARLLERSGDHARALDAYREAATDRPWTPHADLADAYANAGRLLATRDAAHDEAERALEWALALRPGHATALESMRVLESRRTLVTRPLSEPGPSLAPIPARAEPRLFSSVADVADGGAPGPVRKLASKLENLSTVTIIGGAAAVAIVLVVVSILAIFAPSAETARERAFEGRLGEFLSESGLGPAAETGYVRGRVLVLDKETGTIDPVFHLLRPDLRARTPEEVGTVVWLVWKPVRVDAHDKGAEPPRGAYVQTCQVTVVDKAVGAYVGKKTFRGDDLPAKSYRVSDDLTDEYGPRPVGAVVDFVESLPVLGPGEQPNLLAGGGHSAKPVGPADLYDVEHQTVTLDERGAIASRAKGRALAFRESVAPGVEFEMVEIPGGAFEMGEPGEPELGYSTAQPVHRVAVPQFYMGRTEVTQRLWRAVVALPKVNRDLREAPFAFKGDDLPVEGVSWAEANEFCLRLSRATGRNYRLPTEAEWEYACRGGAAGPYATGAFISAAFANVGVDPEDPKSPKGADRKKTTPAGSLGVANGFGLFDMDGNVSEWCQDVYHINYHGAPADGSAWLDPSAENERVNRGGAWLLKWDESRVFRRFAYRPQTAYSCLGFRLALSP